MCTEKWRQATRSKTRRKKSVGAFFGLFFHFCSLLFCPVLCSALLYSALLPDSTIAEIEPNPTLNIQPTLLTRCFVSHVYPVH